MGIPSPLPVADDAVQDAVQHHQQTDGLQILAQVLDVVAGDAAVGVDVGLVGKYVEAPGGKQLQRQGNFMGRRLLLPQKVVIQVLQCRRVALIFADIAAIDVGGAAVDDGFLLRAHLLRTHELLTQAHNELEIMELEAMLKNVVIIDETHTDGKTVTMGSIVRIKFVDLGFEDEFKIVGSAEADIDAKPKSISNDSPVGAALLGKSIDEITNVEAPGGLMKVKIISIRR